LEIHANVIDCILHQSFFIAAQSNADGRSVHFFSSGFPWDLDGPRYANAGGGSALPDPRPWLRSTILHFWHGWWLNFGVPALTLVPRASRLPLSALFEKKKKRRVRSAFGNISARKSSAAARQSASCRQRKRHYCHVQRHSRLTTIPRNSTLRISRIS